MNIPRPSLHPSSHPFSSLPAFQKTAPHKFSRLFSTRTLPNQPYVPYALAAQIKEAVSPDPTGKDTFEGLIPGTEKTPLPPAGTAGHTPSRLLTKESVAFMDTGMTFLGDTRTDESKTFTPCFPPGRMLHMKVHKSNR